MKCGSFIRQGRCRTPFIGVLLWAFAERSSGGRTVDVFLVTGQSNALGTIQGTLPKADPPVGSVAAERWRDGRPVVPFWFDNFHGYRDSADVALGASTAWGVVAMQPRGPYRFPFAGPEVGLARGLHGAEWRDVAVVKVARDGGGNTLWQRSSRPPAPGTVAGRGVAYWKVVETLRSATAPDRLAAIGYDDFRLAGLVYDQGESNTAAEAADAAQRLAQFAADLRADVRGRGGDLRVVVVENLGTASNRAFGINGWQGTAGAGSPSGVSNANLRAWAADDPSRRRWMTTADLTIVNTDGLKIHADADGQLTIGRRAADAFVALSAGRSAGSGGP